MNTQCDKINLRGGCMDKTRMFNLKEIEDALVETTLDEVREALREKGYNPVNQIVGYLVTGDETFITNYKDARKKILSIDIGVLIETIVRSYLEN